MTEGTAIAPWNGPNNAIVVNTVSFSADPLPFIVVTVSLSLCMYRRNLKNTAVAAAAAVVVVDAAVVTRLRMLASWNKFVLELNNLYNTSVFSVQSTTLMNCAANQSTNIYVNIS